MKTILIISWRNLWRNRKRTLITVSSVFFALIFVVLTRSLQIGSYEHMINGMTGMYTGHVQVSAAGFNDNRSLDRTLIHSEELLEKLYSSNEARFIIPRFESFALAAGTDRSRPVMVIGTVPETEDRMTGFKDNIVEGRFITSSDNGIVIGQRLASQLRVSAGDSLVFLGQGYMGVSAANIFEVTGIAHIPIPELNSRMVMMPLAAAQDFYAAEGRLTSYVVMLDDIKLTDRFAAAAENLLGEDYDVEVWTEILKEIVQQIKADEIQGFVVIWLLYVIVGFGIFGTVLMMTKERQKEFGVMLAVGMKRIKMCFMVFTESVIISFIGVTAGFVASIPVLLYFRLFPISFSGDMADMMIQMGWEPIMPVSFAHNVFTTQMIVIFLISAAVSFYPIIVIAVMKPVKAMKQ